MFHALPAVSDEHEEGEVVEEDKDIEGHTADKCIDLTGTTETEEYEERRVFYHSSSGYYYDPVSVRVHACIHWPMHMRCVVP